MIQTTPTPLTLRGSSLQLCVCMLRMSARRDRRSEPGVEPGTGAQGGIVVKQGASEGGITAGEIYKAEEDAENGEEGG